MRRLLLSALPLALLLACQAGNTAGTSTRPGGDAGSGGAAASTPIALATSCTQAELGSPVLRLLNRAQFTSTISDIFPQVSGAWSSTLPADPVSAFGFDNDAATVVGPQLAEAMLDTASSVATAVTGSALAAILPCSASAADRACAAQFVSQYGRRFFRRALTPAEQARYVGFFDSALVKSDFKTALKWVTVGLIQSPNAVYRSEIGSAAGATRRLSQLELASELAYTYTGSTPTEALLAQAEGGTPLDVAAEAKALLESEAGKATLQHFFESYLDYTRVASIERSGIAQFDTVRSAMVEETHRFIDQVLIQNHGGLKELLTAGTTNPSQALAAYYGFSTPAADYAPVERGPGRGLGVLAQGSVLASRAQPNGSSPTQRGLLVFSRLLCNTKPSPPANVPAIGDPAPGQETTRQRYEDLHAKSPACNTCHKLFDPIGFGFEHFDEGGRYRETEDGLTIDTVSAVPKPDGSALFQFQDQASLARGLAQQAVIYQCFSAYLATYAFGSGEACLAATRVPELQAGTLGILDYYAALASEPHFTSRTSQ